VRYTPVCAASCDSAVWIESNRTWRLYWGLKTVGSTDQMARLV
jgi:hypothetical protein